MDSNYSSDEILNIVKENLKTVYNKIFLELVEFDIKIKEKNENRIDDN